MFTRCVSPIYTQPKGRVFVSDACPGWQRFPGNQRFGVFHWSISAGNAEIRQHGVRFIPLREVEIQTCVVKSQGRGLSIQRGLWEEAIFDSRQHSRRKLCFPGNDLGRAAHATREILGKTGKVIQPRKWLKKGLVKKYLRKEEVIQPRKWFIVKKTVRNGS